MRKRLFVLLTLVVAVSGCSEPVRVEEALRLTEVQTGWYDAGIIDQKNKLVPSISLRLENISQEPIASVQLNAIFRREGEAEAWGEHYVRAIGTDGLPGGQTGGSIVLRSNLGYTGTQSRLQMLQNAQFIDTKVEIFGKQGSRTWQKLGEFVIDRQLLTQ